MSKRKASDLEGSAAGSSKEAYNIPQEAIKAFNIVQHVSALLPDQVFEASDGFSKDQYTRDLWELFAELPLPDPKLASLYIRWVHCRKPSYVELIASRYPPAGGRPRIRFTSLTKTQQIVKTLEAILAQVSEQTQAELHRRFSQLHLDYLMFLVIRGLRSGDLDKAMQQFPEYEEQVEKLLQRLQESAEVQPKAPTLPTVPPTVPPPNPLPSSAPGPSALQAVPPEAAAMFEGLRVDPNSVKELGKIGGMHKAKQAVKQATYIARECPHLTQRRYGCKNILLHGPPGTGKTTVALAFARDAQLPVFKVSSSHLVDKWVGVPERNVRAMFVVANSHAPCVIVLDEVDAVCGPRRAETNDGTQRMASELLMCMSEFPKVIIVGTTNLPWSIDQAFLRRFQKRILVGLPSAEEREAIFQLLLDDFPHKVQLEEMKTLGEMTPGFSGDSIERCIESAADVMVAGLEEATCFEKTMFQGQPAYQPSSEGVSKSEFPWHLVLPAPLGFQDLSEAIKEVACDVEIYVEAERKHLAWAKSQFVSSN